MLRTIKIGDYISVQGICIKTLPDGQLQVRVGDRIFCGTPVAKTA